MDYIKLGSKKIGFGFPAYIVAEIGLNHNGDMALAEKTILAAKEAGADAVKFQNYFTEDFISNTTITHEYISNGVKKIENANLIGWDDHEIFTQRIRNYSARPIEVEVRREFNGHVLFRSSLQPKLHDFQTVEFKASVATGKRKDLRFEVLRHQGINSKQNNITLETAEVQ